MAQNFMEKTFADGSQTSKFAKVFPLKSFPLWYQAKQQSTDANMDDLVNKDSDTS